MQLVLRQPCLLHTQWVVVRVQFPLILLSAVHLIKRKLLDSLFAVVAVEENLEELVHSGALRYQKTLVL